MFHSLRRRLSQVGGNDSALLLAAVSINSFGAGMFFPFALLYYQAATSLSVGTIGLALTCATLISLSIGPITGTLVDRYGARRLVVYSQCIEATGFVMYLAVASPISLFAAALIATSGTRMFYASFSALVAESNSGAERDRWYGLVGVTQSVGSSLSGFLASIVIGSIGLVGFRGVIVFNVCCLLASALLIQGQHHHAVAMLKGETSSSYRVVLRDRVFLKIVACNGLFVLCSMLIGIAFAVYATEALHAPLWSVGVAGIIQTGLVVGVQTKVIERVASFRRTRVMLWAGLVWINACLLFALAVVVPHRYIVPYIIVAAVTFTIAQILYLPASRSLAAGLGPTAVRGRYIAVYELSWGMAAAAGPAIFGLTYELAPPIPWLTMSVVVLVAMAILVSGEKGIPMSRNRPTAALDQSGTAA